MEIVVEQNDGNAEVEAWKSSNMTYANFDKYLYDSRKTDSPFRLGSYYVYKFNPDKH
jgi:hypothetical protein